MSFVTGILGKVVNRFANIGLGQLPGVLTVYRLVWRHFGPKGLVLATVGDMKLYVIGRDWATTPTMLFAHSWEPAETAIFKKHIKAGMTVIDAGAYIGYYSVLASKLVGANGTVYSFEPSPENADTLGKNAKLNDCNNIQIIRKAVSSKSGRTTFYPNPCNASGSTMFKDYSTHNSKDPEIEVEVVSLDDAVGNRKVDFIKMDIEGGETNTLKGMTNIIRNNPNLKMIVEVFPIGLKNVGSSLEEFVESLQQYFMLYTVDSYGGTLVACLRDIQQEIKKSAVINLFCVRKEKIG
jgi:FkbM family methyltransferase